MSNIANDSDASSAPVIPPTVPPEQLKAAFRHHAAGVTVVTADVGEGPLALTASSVTSVSADPAVLLFSVASTTETGRALARARTAVIHLLTADDHALAVRCATPGVERFPLVHGRSDGWAILATGEPAFLGPRILLRGEIFERMVLGEATVLVLAVTEVIDRSDPMGPPAGALAYHDRIWHVLDDRSALP